MVNGAWSRQLEVQFLREVFTIRQGGAMRVVCSGRSGFHPVRTKGSLTPAAAAEAHASTGGRILRIDSPGTFSSMR
jgi:hypothetical protein